MALSEGSAERHREVAARFGEIAAGVVDWDAPSPVAPWSARDVVAHLVEWFPGFLAAGGISLVGRSTAVSDDPYAAWVEHAAAVQALFEDADRPFTHPRVGSYRLADAVDMFYTSDIFMHTWDLAKAAGVDARLDADFAAALLAGMEPIDEMLRASGQYGPAMPVAADAPVADRLMAFAGRDPGWVPAG